MTQNIHQSCFWKKIKHANIKPKTNPELNPKQGDPENFRHSSSKYALVIHCCPLWFDNLYTEKVNFD